MRVAYDCGLHWAAEYGREGALDFPGVLLMDPSPILRVLVS